MGWTAEPVQTEIEDLFVDMDKPEKDILQLLRAAEDGLSVNQLVEQSELPYAQVAASLMVLEMSSLVKMLPGNMYRALK